MKKRVHLYLEQKVKALDIALSIMNFYFAKLEIEDLTDEQLKHGDAIDLIILKHKDFAKETTDNETQVKNAFRRLYGVYQKKNS